MKPLSASWAVHDRERTEVNISSEFVQDNASIRGCSKALKSCFLSINPWIFEHEGYFDAGLIKKFLGHLGFSVGAFLKNVLFLIRKWLFDQF